MNHYALSLSAFTVTLKYTDVDIIKFSFSQRSQVNMLYCFYRTLLVPAFMPFLCCVKWMFTYNLPLLSNLNTEILVVNCIQFSVSINFNTKQIIKNLCISHFTERHKHKLIINNQAPYEMVAPAKIHRINSLIGTSR